MFPIKVMTELMAMETQQMTLHRPILIQTHQLKLKKRIRVTDNNGNGKTDIGDTITYTITVSNTGDTTLTGINFIDTFVSSLGATLTYTTAPVELQQVMVHQLEP